MANLKAARRNLSIVLAVFLVVDVAAVVVLFSPRLGASAGRSEEFDQVRQQVQSKARTVVPPEQIQSRIDAARQQIAEFYQRRLPPQSSAVFDHLGKLASQHRVRLEQARYQNEETDIPGLRTVRIDATLSGDYVDEVKFINALERDPMFFIVDSVRLGESQGGNVTLGLRLETYLRGNAQ